METIGHRIKIARVSKDSCQDYIATKLGITQAAYSKIESGQTPITVSRLMEICQLLNVDPKEMIDGVDNLIKH